MRPVDAACGARAWRPPLALLAEAEAMGLLVFAEGGRLVVLGPEGADEGLVRALLAAKEELMPLLVSPTELETELYEERAAIAEHDGGLLRGHAEWLAWEGLLADRERAFREGGGP